MKFAKHLAMFAALGSTPAAAAPINAQDMLVSSSPAAASTQRGGIDTISLNFAESARVFSVTLYLPDDSKISVYPADSDTDTPAAKGKNFSFRLSKPLTAAGQYKISYLLTSKSFKSLNGFIDFEVKESGDTSTDDAALARGAERTSDE